MVVTIRARVVGLGSDSDPYTGQGYTSVSLAIESPIPRPPAQLANQYPPVPRPTVYKHVMHIFIPNSQWRNRYSMWAEYDIIIEDTGEMRLALARENV